ncbi:hypothetical protein EDB80DRAFT_685203 [Ilyonectria destructans]|nr:hypothetical protein EDB80DRAFT_685203 [Ilyonectria destructans]
MSGGILQRYVSRLPWLATDADNNERRGTGPGRSSGTPCPGCMRTRRQAARLHTGNSRAARRKLSWNPIGVRRPGEARWRMDGGGWRMVDRGWGQLRGSEPRAEPVLPQSGGCQCPPKEGAGGRLAGKFHGGTWTRAFLGQAHAGPQHWRPPNQPPIGLSRPPVICSNDRRSRLADSQLSFAYQAAGSSSSVLQCCRAPGPQGPSAPAPIPPSRLLPHLLYCSITNPKADAPGPAAQPVSARSPTHGDGYHRSRVLTRPSAPAKTGWRTTDQDRDRARQTGEAKTSLSCGNIPRDNKTRATDPRLVACRPPVSVKATTTDHQSGGREYSLEQSVRGLKSPVSFLLQKEKEAPPNDAIALARDAARLIDTSLVGRLTGDTAWVNGKPNIALCLTILPPLSPSAVPVLLLACAYAADTVRRSPSRRFSSFIFFALDLWTTTTPSHSMPRRKLSDPSCRGAAATTTGVSRPLALAERHLDSAAHVVLHLAVHHQLGLTCDRGPLLSSSRPLLAPNSFISHLLRTPGPLSLTEKAPIFLHLWQAQQSLQAIRREERQRLVRGLCSTCPSSPLKPVTVPVSQPLPSELPFFILNNGHCCSPPPPYIPPSCHPRLWIPLRPNRAPPFDEFPPPPRPQLIPSFSPGSRSEYSSAGHLRSISQDPSPQVAALGLPILPIWTSPSYRHSHWV